jgi:putative DNA primase/helicase
MAGARYISINELQAGSRLDEQVVKQLAGRELISARFLYKESFEFSPTFTAWIRTNHKPIITGEDDGIWRRLVILPFLRQFKNNEKDPTLEEKLMGECDGILMWMLKGTQDYRQIGLRLSPTIRREGAQYRKDSDLLGEFIQDKLTVDPNARIEKSNLFSIWKSWCEVNGCKHGISKTFTQRMAERGYVVVKSNGQRFYAGVRL